MVVILSLSRVQLLPTWWTVAHQAPLFMGFPRQEYYNGLPFPFQGVFLTQGSNPCLLLWQEDSLPTEAPENPTYNSSHVFNHSFIQEYFLRTFKLPGTECACYWGYSSVRRIVCFSGSVKASKKIRGEKKESISHWVQCTWNPGKGHGRNTNHDFENEQRLIEKLSSRLDENFVKLW